MEYTKLMRQKLLSKFFCPFTCDFNQPNNDCPFWHWAPPEESDCDHEDTECTYECPLNIRVKPLPPYCCASYLASKCSKWEYTFQCGSDLSAEILTRCEDGFHMEVSELDDLQLFAQKMAKVLLEASEFRLLDFKSIVYSDHGYCRNPVDVLNPLPSNYISAGNKRPRHVLFKDDENEDENDNSCAICLDPLKNHQIGHLDNCSHVFCAKCIHKWQNQGVNEGCPVCRKLITKILVWPKLLQTQEKKKQLFDLISGGVPSDERVDRAMSNDTPTIYKSSKGKTMRALQMNPESMKVFLKKPKPNWNCYVMTELAVERSVPSVGSETFTNNEENVAAGTNSLSSTRLGPSNLNELMMSLNRIMANMAAINNSATNNVSANFSATYNIRVRNNVVTIIETRQNNHENNRRNNDTTISNIATNIASTNANNDAATNNVSIDSTATNNVEANSNSIVEQIQSNIPTNSAIPTALRGRYVCILHTQTNNVASNLASTNHNLISPTTTTNNVSANEASNSRASESFNTSQLPNLNQTPVVRISPSQASEIMRIFSSNPVDTNLSPNVSSTNTIPTNQTPSFNVVQIDSIPESNATTNNSAANNVTPNIASTNANPTNLTAANNGAPNSHNNVQTFLRGLPADCLLQSSDGKIATFSLSALNTLFSNNEFS